MDIIKTEITSPVLTNLFYFHQNMICNYKCIELKHLVRDLYFHTSLFFNHFFFFNYKVEILSKVIRVDALHQKVRKNSKITDTVFSSICENYIPVKNKRC